MSNHRLHMEIVGRASAVCVLIAFSQGRLNELSCSTAWFTYTFAEEALQENFVSSPLAAKKSRTMKESNIHCFIIIRSLLLLVGFDENTEIELFLLNLHVTKHDEPTCTHVQI